MSRKDVSAERKNQILDTAANVFARMGLHQARMDDIVRESGLSKGAIYWYFKSKDDIIATLVQRFFDQEMHEMQAVRDQDISAHDKLIHITRIFNRDLHQIHDMGLMPLFYDFYALAIRNDPTQSFLQAYFRTTSSFFATIFQQGIDRGEFRPIDPHAAAVTLIALFEGLILIWLIDPERVDPDAQIQASVHLLLQSIAADGSAS